MLFIPSTYVIILKQLFASGSVNIVEQKPRLRLVFIHRYSLRLRQIIVKYLLFGHMLYVAEIIYFRNMHKYTDLLSYTQLFLIIATILTSLYTIICSCHLN